MRDPVRSVVIALTILILAPLAASAGEDAPERQLIIVHEAYVNPDRTADHEALIKEFLALTPELDHSMPFATFMLEDGRFFYATPLDGYAGVEAFEAAWMETMGAMGEEKMAEFTARSEGVTHHHRDSLWWERLDLSYIPEGVEVDPDKATFRSWGWFYGKPGHEMQIEEYFKKYVELYEKNDIKRGWYAYMGSIGSDAPVYVWAEVAESEAAFTAMTAAIAEKLGDEAMDMWNGMVQHARKVEYLRGTYRPDLSYTPKAEE
jgi:hypothetical protein